MPLVSLSQANKQLEMTQDYLTTLVTQKEVITQLKALTEEMDRRGSTTSQAMVDSMLAQVIDKYNTLKAKAEERQTDMQVGLVKM
jgi:molybdenum-dependent DNA-binding transcriptional regulator ModE